jgi:tRNA-Thr(GGU) m(6)t(6)A37 methyltransferase TsaA
LTYHPIGIIHSPFKEPVGVPIQAAVSEVRGTVEVLSEYGEGLRDIDGFSHIMLIYHFHLSGDYSLSVRPYMDDSTHGLFCTRAPSRPNPIGVSVVRLEGVEGTVLEVSGLDVVDGTPLLDIKPYIPSMDDREGVRQGWLEGKLDRLEKVRDDGRFYGDRSGGR